MRYLLVVWVPSEPGQPGVGKYEVISYSHARWEAEEQYERLKEKYPGIILMVDAFKVREEEKKKELYDMLEGLRGNS